jgi:carboxyl-terminal processing protease
MIEGPARRKVNRKKGSSRKEFKTVFGLRGQWKGDKIMKVLLSILVLFLTACSAVNPALPTSVREKPEMTVSAIGATVTATEAATASISEAATSPASELSEVRACDYVPGVSVPVQIAPEVPAQVPTPTLERLEFKHSVVVTDTLIAQLKLYQQIWDKVNDNYVYADFNGRDWQAIGKQYEALIRQGLYQDDFYLAMQQMILDLDGGLSRWYSPSEWADEASIAAGTKEYVGIGGLYYRYDRPDPAMILTWVMPGGPADQAGLKSHDAILKVNNGPVFDSYGNPKTLGPEGAVVDLTVQTPGQPPRQVRLTRARLSGMPDLDYCLVPTTRIGYMHLINFVDPELIRQVTKSLDQMSAGGPLQGLILDMRDSPSGRVDNDLDLQFLGLFTKGELGSLISRGQATPISVTAWQDVHGSQTVPLVVLQDQDSPQIDQMLGGVLQAKGRARIVGEAMPDPLYLFVQFHFSDGSLLELAENTFQPVGQSNGSRYSPSVVPDEEVLSRWDLFTEATDPLLAKAVEILRQD